MNEIASAENSVSLLDAAHDAAGGLERWREHSFLSAHLSQGGGLRGMKGQAGVLDDVRIDVALHQEWVSHHPSAHLSCAALSLPAGSRSETGTGRLSRRSTIRGPRSPRMSSTPRGRAHGSPTSWEPRCGHTSPNRSTSPFPASALRSFQPSARTESLSGGCASNGLSTWPATARSPPAGNHRPPRPQRPRKTRSQDKRRISTQSAPPLPLRGSQGSQRLHDVKGAGRDG